MREFAPELIRTIAMKPDTLNRVQNALADVVNDPAAPAARRVRRSFEVAGKTGTAQVVEMKGGYVKSEQLSYFTRDHAWFVSYAPVEIAAGRDRRSGRARRAWR